MKTLKTILYILSTLVFFAFITALISFNVLNSAKYLLPVSHQASRVLGRNVTIGKFGPGFSWAGITLDAGPLVIADDDNFTSQPFIKVYKIRIGFDLNSLIFKREFRIKYILLQSPQIHFIRSMDGKVNIQSIGEGPKPFLREAPKSSVVEGSLSINKSPVIAVLASPKSEAFPFDNINIIIRDASISYIDQNQAFPVDLWMTGANLSLNDFSVSKPVVVSLDASVLSNLPNVHINASLILDLSKRNVSISGLNFHTDLSQLDFDLLKRLSPHFLERSDLRNIGGMVQLNVEDLKLGTSKDINTHGEILITGGVIKNLNVIKLVLSHTLGTFGWMEGNIENLLTGPLKDKLDARDTVLEKADAKFSVHDQSFFIDDLRLQTDIFEFTAKGPVDRGLNMDLQTMLYLNGDISALLVNQLDGLRFLCDDSKRIAVDASLKGVFPHLKYKPNKDFRKKSKKALLEEGGNILGILFK